jgi:hypothetical protein
MLNRPRPAVAPLEALEVRRLLSGATGSTTIWIEGEDRSAIISETFNEHPWYRVTGLRQEMLSDADGNPGTTGWLAHFRQGAGDQGTASVRYSVDAAEAGEYRFWARVNAFDSVYDYRINGGSWQSLNLDFGAGRQNLLQNGIDLRFIGWQKAEPVQLQQGSNTVEIRLSSFERSNDWWTHGGIDALAFSNSGWEPAGPIAYDPDRPAADADDWFLYRAGPDEFSDESVTDLSFLLDDVAGERGALQRTGDGDDFQFADGTPVKFWAVGAAPPDTLAGMEQQAQFLAKNGVNMIRVHPVQDIIGNPTIDPDRLDHFDQWFSVLKDHGIYSTWSVFYHHRVTQAEVPADLWNELPGGSTRDSYGHATYVDEYQQSQNAYVTTLLNHVNPYTGLAYKDDHALAVVEVRNEDSVFFHNPLTTLWNGRNGAWSNHADRLREMFGDWVKDNYANESELAAAWGSSNQFAADSWADGTFEIAGAFHMGADGPLFEFANRQERMGDFIRFLAEMQRQDYQERIDLVRGLGFDGITVSTAWQAGGAGAGAANLWTDDAADAIDRHNYRGGHAGGHGISVGNVNNDSHLDTPFEGVPSQGLWQVADKPFIFTEFTQLPPNQWKAELLPIVTAYGLGLQGWDATYHFNLGRSVGMEQGWPGLSSYVSQTPAMLGQSAALARALHEGHFDEGAVIAERNVSLDEAFSGEAPINSGASQSPGGNPGDDKDIANAQVMAVGRVTAKVADGLGDSVLGDDTPYWDRANERITSNTGQLVWDYGNEWIELRSDRTQGVVGFAGGESFDLGGVKVTVETGFVSLLFTSLDGRPIETSENVLITALARDRQAGSQYNAAGSQLLDLGVDALELEPVRATIEFEGAAVGSLTPLDVYGVPTDEQVPQTADNTFVIDGRFETFYYEMERTETVPAAPAAPALAPADDTGVSSSDGVTWRSSNLRFDVSADPGQVVRLFRDGTLVAGPTADAAQMVDPASLPEGTYAYTTTVAASVDGPQSPASPAAVVRIDTDTPDQADFAFTFNDGPADHRFRLAFDETVFGFSAGDVVVRNVTDALTLPTGDFDLIDLGEGVFDLLYDPTDGNDMLPDGRYDVTIAGGSVIDQAGNASAAFAAGDFFLRGDANRDATVNLSDFLILRRNFGSSEAIFSEADFNNDGQVNLSDFLALRRNFGETLPPPSLFDDGDD